LLNPFLKTERVFEKVELSTERKESTNDGRRTRISSSESEYKNVER